MAYLAAWNQYATAMKRMGYDALNDPVLFRQGKLYAESMVQLTEVPFGPISPKLL